VSALQVLPTPTAPDAAPTPAPAKPVEHLLTFQQVAELAGVSRWTVWRWHTAEGLRVVKIGSVVRVKQSDWESFVARHLNGGEVQK
jgi:excisionase family DNA binding protein